MSLNRLSLQFVADLGDHEVEDRRIVSYMEKMRLSRQYSPSFVTKVMDLHSNLT